MRNHYLLILTVILATLASAFAGNPFPAHAADDEDLAAARQEVNRERAQRAERRAFYTAPPVIPHEVAPNKAGECQFCHEEVKKTPNGISVKTPHPEHSNCFQCHVVNQSELGAPEDARTSGFEGLIEPHHDVVGKRAAPPTIPHRMALRENCKSCHDPENPYRAQRTPHAGRAQCIQCHVTNRSAEFEIATKK